MPAPIKARPNSIRYTLLKLNTAVETFFRSLSVANKTEQYHRDQGNYNRVDSSEGSPAKKEGPPSKFKSALQLAREAFEKPLSTTMYIAGPAMQPGLNRGHSRDHESLERLVVRLIPFPGPDNVCVGDVVAFYNPIARQDEHSIMIRRVAASEGQEMEVGSSSSSDDANVSGRSGPMGLKMPNLKGPVVGLPPFGGKYSPFGADEPEGSIVTIPDGHCWVLADNPDLGPPDVIDSRTFGYVPYKNIVGRVIYAAASTADHGPVQNNPESMNSDEPLIEGEVDVEKLFQDELEDEGEEEEVPEEQTSEREEDATKKQEEEAPKKQEEEAIKKQEEETPKKQEEKK